MAGVKVTLTPPELRLAAYVEVERRVDNLFNDRRSRNGAPQDWSIGIEGAAAEMAFAKLRGLYWSGAIGDLRAKDVGGIQIRSTKVPDGSLILHDSDADEDVFVLAVGVAPTFCFVGWLRAKDGKKSEFWRDPVGGRAAYFVPQSQLKSLP